MKMRQRPVATTEDNAESLKEIRRQMGEVIRTAIGGRAVKSEMEFEICMDFICEVLEAKESRVCQLKNLVEVHEHNLQRYKDATRKLKETFEEFSDDAAGLVGGPINCPSVVKVMTTCDKPIVAHGRCVEHQPTELDESTRCEHREPGAGICVRPRAKGSNLCDWHCFSHQKP